MTGISAYLGHYHGHLKDEALSFQFMLQRTSAD